MPVATSKSSFLAKNLSDAVRYLVYFYTFEIESVQGVKIHVEWDKHLRFSSDLL